MTKAYKNLFDFVYSTLGYSPGGVYENGVITFNHKSLPIEDFMKLEPAFIEYELWFDQSEEKPEKRIPSVEFALEMGATFGHKMEKDGYTSTQIGDTRLWEKV